MASSTTEVFEFWIPGSSIRLQLGLNDSTLCSSCPKSCFAPEHVAHSLTFQPLPREGSPEEFKSLDLLEKEIIWLESDLSPGLQLN